MCCSLSFLFSIMNPKGVAPSKMPLKDQQYAIYCESNMGPTFGKGLTYDLHISNDANTSGKSYSFLGCSYQLPTGQHTFFTGANNFDVTDYEVFGICL